MTPNWDPCHVLVSLSQHVELASHRGRLHPVAVLVNDATLSPIAARQLARLLLDLADKAEALS